jgi:hypothetical protein
MTLLSVKFTSADELTRFVEKNGISQGNIQSITSASTSSFPGYVLFYWGANTKKHLGT